MQRWKLKHIDAAHHCHRLVVTAANRMAAVAMADALFGDGWVVSAIHLLKGERP